MFARALARAFLLAIALLPAGAVSVSGDDGRPGPSRPVIRPTASLPPTGGRPHQLPLGEESIGIAETTMSGNEIPLHVATRTSQQATLVIVVGGYGTTPRDGTFEDLKARIEGRRGFTVERLGEDPATPYDSYAHLDESARVLIKKIRDEGPSYPGGVHIISHSGGGAVVDRAFAVGLSSADGVRSFQAVAPPHNGSIVAAWTERVLPHLGEARDFVRAVFMLLTPDLESDALWDLAHLDRVSPPPGVIEIDYTLASDTFVMQQDNVQPGVPLRIYRPRGLHETLMGHDSFHDVRLRDDVVTAVHCSCVPGDTRSAREIAADQKTRDASTLIGLLELAAATLFAVGLAVWFYRQPIPVRLALNRWAKGYLRARGR